MTKSRACLGAAILLLVIPPAFGADLGRPLYKTPAAPVYVPYSWTGFYIGINGGPAWGSTEVSSVLGATSFDVRGSQIGGTLGYNYQMGSWVWGLETDIDYSNVGQSSSVGVCAIYGGCEVRNRWMGTARVRLGTAAWDRWLLYVTGGAAYGDVRLALGNGVSATKTRVGWTVGAGVEYALTRAWSAKFEYLWEDLGKGSVCPVGVCGVDTSVRFNASVIRTGFNYRF